MKRSSKLKILLALDKIRDSLSDVEKAMDAEDGAEGKRITLADKVMMLRERGLTQMEIAKEIGASQSRVSNILNSLKEWKEKK